MAPTETSIQAFYHNRFDGRETIVKVLQTGAMFCNICKLIMHSFNVLHLIGCLMSMYVLKGEKSVKGDRDDNRVHAAGYHILLSVLAIIFGEEWTWCNWIQSYSLWIHLGAEVECINWEWKIGRECVLQQLHYWLSCLIHLIHSTVHSLVCFNLLVVQIPPQVRLESKRLRWNLSINPEPHAPRVRSAFVRHSF